MKKKCLIFFLFFFIAQISFASFAGFGDFEKRPLVDQRSDIRKYIRYMVKTYHFNKHQLTDWFNTIPAVSVKKVPLASRPAIHQVKGRHDFIPWYQYRNFFINQKVVDQGLIYWSKNQKWLTKANNIYGVPQNIIVATIGMETKYGEQMGKYPVFKTLAVLAFDYDKGPRRKYFLKEFTAFLLYCRDNQLDPLSIKGSYTGAIGEPQFMPSNISRYAIDFDGKHNIDLSKDDADAIGSVAHFYHVNHWQTGKPVAIQANIKGEAVLALLKKNPNPKMTVQAFEKYGIYAYKKNNGKELANLVVLAGDEGPEYWLTFYNFRVLRNYNNSTDYAMALYQLSTRIAARYDQQLVRMHKNNAKHNKKPISTSKKSINHTRTTHSKPH